jgi:hypothetical protein
MQVFILLFTILTAIVLYLLTPVINNNKDIFLKAEPIRKKICPICPTKQYCSANTNYKCVKR